MAADAMPAAHRATAALAIARGAALFVAIGAAAVPPLVSLASVVMLAAFAALPDAWPRLRRVLAEPLGRGVLALLVVLLLALAVGLLRLPAAQALHGALGWRHLLMLPVVLALFDDPRARQRFALGFIAFAVVAALASIVMLALGLTYKEGHLPGVLLRNPVTQALTFAVAAFLAALLVATRQVGPRWLRVALALAAAGLVAQLVFAQTGRSGQVALLVMATVSFLLLLRGRARVAALVALPLLAAAAYSASPVLQQRYTLALTEMRNAADLPEYSSMGIRVIIWQTSAALVAERPLLGYGIGGFAPAYAERIKAIHSGGWKAMPTGDPHNQYLYLWAEAGVLGLLGFALFIVGAARQPADDPYRAAGLALLAAWCTTSLFSSHFQTFNEGHLIVIFLGVLLARTQAAAPAAGAAR